MSKETNKKIKNVKITLQEELLSSSFFFFFLTFLFLIQDSFYYPSITFEEFFFLSRLKDFFLEQSLVFSILVSCFLLDLIMAKCF